MFFHGLTLPCSSCCFDGWNYTAIEIALDLRNLPIDSKSGVSSYLMHYVFVAPTEAFLPVEHMQDVGQSLPELANELVAAQDSQHFEVEHRAETLRKLEVVRLK